ncbi:MAG: DUF3119 family protein [Cyanobacteria bacterium P01_D01_bin.105]
MTSSSTEVTTLSPDFRLGGIITILSLPCLLISLWLAMPIALLGLFLLYQTTSIRLTFTPIALEASRGEAEPFKTFPYKEWESWTLFWSPVPILFYFKEINSIHFLPMLFSPAELETALERHVAHCKTSA